MTVFVAVPAAGSTGSDELRDLSKWLLEEPELRGAVRLAQRVPQPGELGALDQGLQVALGSGGAVAALAGVVVAWLRARPGEVTVKISRGEDAIELTAKGVKSLDAEGLRSLTGHVAEVAAKALPPDSK